MEVVRRSSGWATMSVVLTFAVLVMLPQVYSVRYIVGGNMGWTSNVNYTNWAKGKHFYNGDWLFFVYDRNQMDIVELKNKTDYENCITNHPLHNWTTGAGRDVVPLNVTRTYYFASSKGYCFGGMKLAIHVENPPPPPKASPVKSGATNVLTSFKGQILIPALFATAAVWDAFLLLW